MCVLYFCGVISEYYVSRDGTVTKETVEKGVIRLPEVKYGHKIKICETKSPLGYVIGRSGWANLQAAINEFYIVVQQEIWRYTDGLVLSIYNTNMN